ncbi:MAG: hypothetical protein KIT69_06025 [Propionibacteriaceae bacterium]|nr:hypothetical protein [Propionibacteriaceae bacterium]
MNKTSAQDQMEILLGADVLGLLSEADINWCLERSSQAGDYDPWITSAEAASLLGGRASRGELVEWDSVGQRVKRTKADWFGWAARLRADSPRSGGVSVDFAFIVI